MLESIELEETTSTSVADGWRVGTSNIYERDLPDASGVVASRLSAALTIADADNVVRNRAIVTVYANVTIGADWYCVTNIIEKNGRGLVSLVKLQ